MILTHYLCRTYTADGAVSTQELCSSESAAILRADEWRAFGLSATACRVEVDTSALTLTITSIG